MDACPVCKDKDSRFEFIVHEQVIMSMKWNGQLQRKVGKVLYQSKKGKCSKCGAQIPLHLAPKGGDHAGSAKERKSDKEVQ